MLAGSAIIKHVRERSCNYMSVGLAASKEPLTGNSQCDSSHRAYGGGLISIDLQY